MSALRSLAALLRGAAVTLTTAVAAVAIHVRDRIFPGTFENLVLSDAGMAAGELWRVATGHLVHLDASHLGINVAALVLLGALLEKMIGGPRMLALVGLSATAIALGVYLDPFIGQYAGLSGVLNAVFACLCVVKFARERSAIWLALLVAAFGKIGWEWSGSPLVTGSLDWPPHVLSHLVGAASGALAGAAGVLFSMRRSLGRWLERDGLVPGLQVP